MSTKTTKKPVNHVALVVDSSGSMRNLTNDVKLRLNEQIETIKKESGASGQETYLSLYTFADRVSNVYREIPVSQAGKFAQYDPWGQTALYDGVLAAVDDLQRIRVPKNVNESYLIITITDGGENGSGAKRSTFTEILRAKNSTDKWSFVFLCPDYYMQHLESAGILRGNIQPWEATERGLATMSGQTQTAYGTYTNLRSTGLASTKTFFSPDLSQVTGAKMARKLEDVSKNFMRLSVAADSRIDDFVKAATGREYVKGSGYYQLTKKEKAVQAYKELIVKENSSNALYRGAAECRRLLGLPVNGTIELYPANHPRYTVYINSTSFNRKLVAGTGFLLDKSLI